jgi:hypothetical protein
VSPALLNEPRPAYERAGSISEADLARIWEGQTFPPDAMTAAGGVRLRVIYRGRRGHGAGPDFRDAIIAAPYGLLEGDIELHLRSSDFRRHGHHLDPAYDGVALHVVMQNDGGVDTTLSNGRRVPVVALGDWLHARSGQILTWLSQPSGWQEPCRTALERLGNGETARTLDRLGDIRFRAAAASFAGRLASGEDPADAAWRGVLDALGYGGQRERFQRLAAALPWSRLSPRLTGKTLSGRRAEALRALSAADDGGRAAVRAPASLRPANRFERRLEGAAALAARWPAGLLRSALSALRLEPAAAARELLRLLTVPGGIGRGRAIEIAANTVLTLLAAVDGGRYERPAERVYARLPLPARYGPVRHLHEAVESSAVEVNARRQQGMLYLLKNYCTQGGCGRCPLS